MSRNPATNQAKEGITLELADYTLANIEATLINKVLKETDWDLKKAAQRLEIARGTLYSKIRKHNIRRSARPALL